VVRDSICSITATTCSFTDSEHKCRQKKVLTSRTCCAVALRLPLSAPGKRSWGSDVAPLSASVRPTQNPIFGPPASVVAQWNVDKRQQFNGIKVSQGEHPNLLRDQHSFCRQQQNLKRFHLACENTTDLPQLQHRHTCTNPHNSVREIYS
jgi:hypothetical protein